MVEPSSRAPLLGNEKCLFRVICNTFPAARAGASGQQDGEIEHCAR